MTTAALSCHEGCKIFSPYACLTLIRVMHDSCILFVYFRGICPSKIFIYMNAESSLKVALYIPSSYDREGLRKRSGCLNTYVFKLGKISRLAKGKPYPIDYIVCSDSHPVLCCF